MPEGNHEEADTRIIVHIMHALQQGMKTIEECTVEIDVVAILVGAFFFLFSFSSPTYKYLDCIWKGI